MHVRLVRGSGDDDRDPDPLPCSPLTPPAPPLRLHLPRPEPRSVLCCAPEFRGEEKKITGGMHSRRAALSWSGAPSFFSRSSLTAVFTGSSTLTFFSCDSGGDFARAAAVRRLTEGREGGEEVVRTDLQDVVYSIVFVETDSPVKGQLLVVLTTAGAGVRGEG